MVIDVDVKEEKAAKAPATKRNPVKEKDAAEAPPATKPKKRAKKEPSPSTSLPPPSSPPPSDGSSSAAFDPDGQLERAREGDTIGVTWVTCYEPNHITNPLPSCRIATGPERFNQSAPIPAQPRDDHQTV